MLRCATKHSFYCRMNYLTCIKLQKFTTAEVPKAPIPQWPDLLPIPF